MHKQVQITKTQMHFQSWMKLCFDSDRIRTSGPDVSRWCSGVIFFRARARRKLCSIVFKELSRSPT